MLPRAITSPEHARIQLNGQRVELLACIPQPAIVYRARVNGTPAGTDLQTQFTYDTGSGTLADVLVGMTLWVGSTLDAYDKGQARVRLDPSGTVFYIGTESDIAILDNDFVTVIDEIGIWQKQVRIASSVIYMDYDVAYTNQNASRLPVVIMGGPVILELRQRPSVTATFNASASWVPGASGNTYLWTAPGASATTGLTTATPTMTYTAAGRYRVSCRVTIGGVPNTRYEWVQVFADSAPPVTQFQCRSITGSKQQGGYTWQMTLYDDTEAGLANVRDRAEVILFTRDYYGSDGQVSTGYATGRENVFARGWISGESISWSPDLSSVTFQVEGAYAWLDRVTAYPQGLQDITGTPAQWVDYNTLTMTAFLWHLLTWRSTVAQAIDCYAEISTTRIIEMGAAATSLWEQIIVTAGQRLLAEPATDHLGRLFILIDAQYRADRSGVVEVMALAPADWRPPIQISRSPLSQTSMVDLSGFKYDGTTGTPFFSLSPGRIWKRYGRVKAVQGMLLDDQTQANTLAGLVAGRDNNDYPTATIQLAANNRFLDIAPDCYVTLTMVADDTPRGISFTNKRFIPRRISWTFDEVSGGLLPTIECEGEAFGEIAVTGDAPPVPPTPVPTPPPTETCPTGYHWDAGLGMCVANSSGGVVTPDLVYVFSDGKMGRARNFISGGAAVNWVDVTGSVSGSGTGVALILDPWGPKAGAWRVWVDSVEHTADLDSTPPTWVQQLAPATVQAALSLSGVVFQRIAGSITEPGLIYVAWYSSTRWGVSVSADSGATWAHHLIDADTHNGNVSVFRIIVSTSIPGKVFVCGGNHNFSSDFCGIYVSNNYGVNWTVILEPAFSVIYDFDIDFPSGGNTIVARDSAGEMYYSGTGGPPFGDNASAITTPGGDSSGHMIMNIATLNTADVLWVEQIGAGGDAEVWHSVDGGINWTSVASMSGIGAGGTRVVAMGRWPYDSKKCFWLRKIGGSGSPTTRIGYSDDLMTTQQNKVGDWYSTIGTVFSDPVMIIPVWVP